MVLLGFEYFLMHPFALSVSPFANILQIDISFEGSQTVNSSTAFAAFWSLPTVLGKPPMIFAGSVAKG